MAKESTPQRTRLLRYLGLVFLLVHSLTYTPANSDDSSVKEFQLKAALLYQIPRYVRFPVDVLHPDSFRLCVVGKNPFGNYFETVEQRPVQERPFQVNYHEKEFNNDQAQACNVIYWSQNGLPTISSEIEDTLLKKSILTFSDGSPQSHVTLSIGKDRRVQFSIDRDSLIKAGLEASSQILRLASNYSEKDK